MISTDRYFKDLSRGDSLKLYLLGDLHLGTVFCVEKEITKYVNIIKNDPWARWLSMGDLAEYITPADKRWDWNVIADWVKPDNIAECQRTRINDVLGPIKDKCLGMIWGNHEDKFRKYNFGNVHENICKDFNAQNLGFSCFIKFHFQRIGGGKTIRVYIGAFTHGKGGAVTETGKLKKLMDFMDQNEANFYGYAHTHACKVATRIELGMKNTYEGKSGGHLARNRIGILTGCFFRTYGDNAEASYGERQLYRPVPIGCGMIEISPWNNKTKYRGYALI